VRKTVQPVDPATIRFDDAAPRVARIAGVIGVLGLLASVGLGLTAGWPRFFQSYLVSFAFFLSLSVGALFFVMLQHLVRAGWSVVVRRLAESLAMNIPALAVAFLPILLALPMIYLWATPEGMANPLIAAKRGYLNTVFFIVRWVVFFGLWSLLAWFFWRNSTSQDLTGDVAHNRRMEKLSAPAMVFFALTLNFAAFDLLMSLDPTWFSTIFGVYYFSGGIVGFFACLSLLTILLQRGGKLRGVVTDEHYHDLGKLVFGFTVFWAYIAFSQFMLIWYANIPEETNWFSHRVHGPWQGVAWLLLFGHFWIPFFYLLPRFVKRRPKLFGPMAAWVLLMCYVDLYWLVLPQSSPDRIPLHPMDVTLPIGMGGLWLALAAHRLGKRSLVPVRDPRLPESLAFENA